MDFCKMCGGACTLVKAHIIPEAFFREIDGGSGTLLFSASEFNKRAFIGPYEKMLCLDCENKFGKVDAYGVDVLVGRFDELFRQEIISDEIMVFRSAKNVIDQDLLQRFFVAVLWRASVSTHTFYKEIHLGKLEKLAAESVNCNAPLSTNFTVSLFRLSDQTENQRLLQKLIRNPCADRMEGINAYRFFFGKIGAFITADSRGLPSQFKGIALAQSDTVEIIGGTFMVDADRTAMDEFFKKQKINGKISSRVKAPRKNISSMT